MFGIFQKANYIPFETGVTVCILQVCSILQIMEQVCLLIATIIHLGGGRISSGRFG